MVARLLVGPFLRRALVFRIYLRQGSAYYWREREIFLGPLPEKACRRNKSHRSNGDSKLMVIIDEVYFLSIVRNGH